MKNVLIIACVILLFASCTKNEMNSDDDFAQQMFVQIQDKYESLPALDSIKAGEVSTYTNFNENGKFITYNGQAIIRDAIPLYGVNDIIFVKVAKEILYLNKSEVNHSIMAYDYTLIGIRIDKDMAIIKGYRVDHYCYLRYNLNDNMVYIYGY